MHPNTAESARSDDRTPMSWVVAWALWDCGAAGYITVVVGFVFTVYLTDVVGADLPGGVSGNTWLGWSLAIAGIVIAVFAPIAGQRSDTGGRQRRSLGIWTFLTVAAMSGLFFVRPHYQYLWLGLGFMGVAAVCFNFASVSYNAMLQQVSTPRTIGRVSAFGWASGSVGGIVLLLICLVGFLAPDGGALGIDSADGLNIRTVALVAAAWLLIFALPVLLVVPDTSSYAEMSPTAPGHAYRRLARDVRGLSRADRDTVYFLGASALFRGGLTTLSALAAVQAVTVYGMSTSEVVVFGVLSGVVGASAALAGGPLDDRFGPKPIIVFSLVGVLVPGVVVLFLSGPLSFWVCGLIISAFFGPALSSSRTYLARVSPPGGQGQMFGLYATGDRVVSFLAPAAYSMFIVAFDTERAGLAGVLLIVAIGLCTLLPLRRPDKRVEAGKQG